ncbi:hypothetical protein T484DRAFT_1814354 [Baffinella frigidus]|nr:hypothetical protein T484DRAFT_1814354 [Cryptophyta sp. CCMP2293]
MGGPPRDASRGGSAEARTGPPQDKLGPPEDRTGPPRDHGEIERLCHAATPPVGRMMSLRNSGDGMSVCEILEDWGIIDANKVKKVAAHEREQRCST